VTAFARSGIIDNVFEEIEADSYPEPPPPLDVPKPLFPLGPADPAAQFDQSFDRCCAKFLLAIRRATLTDHDMSLGPSSEYVLQFSCWRVFDDGRESERLGSLVRMISLVHYAQLWTIKAIEHVADGHMGTIEIERPFHFEHLLLSIRRVHAQVMLASYSGHVPGSWGDVQVNLFRLRYDRRRVGPTGMPHQTFRSDSMFRF
jgi:hypothetical protein